MRTSFCVVSSTTTQITSNYPEEKLGSWNICWKLVAELVRVQEALEAFGEAPPARAGPGAPGCSLTRSANTSASVRLAAAPPNRDATVGALNPGPIRGEENPPDGLQGRSPKVTGEGGRAERRASSALLLLVTPEFCHLRNWRTDQWPHLLRIVFHKSPHFHFHLQKQDEFVCPGSANCRQPRHPYAGGAL